MKIHEKKLTLNYCPVVQFFYWLNSRINYLEFLTVYSNWLSGDSNFARYLDKLKYAVLILEAIGFRES